MASFKGQYSAAVDQKGRVAIPAKFRAAGSAKRAPQFVLTKGLDGCLALYPVAEWKKIEATRAEKMSGLPFSRRDYRFFDRVLNANAIDVAPDKQGRILIPSFLLEASEITSEVLVIGVAERIELWQPAKFQKYLDGYGETIEQVSERLFTQID
ncbi:MAG: division/cell wall cluster transcriptional repressor MraZ [bacterium]